MCGSDGAPHPTVTCAFTIIVKDSSPLHPILLLFVLLTCGITPMLLLLLLLLLLVEVVAQYRRRGQYATAVVRCPEVRCCLKQACGCVW